MAKFDNIQNVSKIKFAHNVQCFCPLGNDWYTNQIKVEFEPRDIIPDYCEIDDFIRSISGQSLIIEDVVAMIYKYISDECNPRTLIVSSFVNDAKHMSVEVIKCSN